MAQFFYFILKLNLVGVLFGTGQFYFNPKGYAALNGYYKIAAPLFADTVRAPFFIPEQARVIFYIN